MKEIEPKVKQLEKSNTKLQTQLDDVTKALEAAKVGGRVQLEIACFISNREPPHRALA